jgi:hypothetical protein
MGSSPLSGCPKQQSERKLASLINGEFPNGSMYGAYLTLAFGYFTWGQRESQPPATIFSL